MFEVSKSFHLCAKPFCDTVAQNNFKKCLPMNVSVEEESRKAAFLSDINYMLEMHSL